MPNAVNSLFFGQALLFVAIVLIFYGAWNIIVLHTEIGRRLKERISGSVALSAGGPGLSLDDLTFKRYEKYLTPGNEEKLDSIRRALIRAGYRKHSDVRLFYALRIILSVGALLAGLAVFPAVMVKMPDYAVVSTIALAVLIAFFIPAFWLERTFQYRRMQIRDGFPDTLDLLLVCIEAGHGFDQALNRIVREMATSHPVLTDELLVVTQEMRAGKDRYQVLKDFADRTDVDDIKSFVTVIMQADKFGVSIAQALRVYSAEMRDKRYMLAEEKVNMMPIKLALGSIMFTVPPSILVMVGPSVIMVIRNLGGLM